MGLPDQLVGHVNPHGLTSQLPVAGRNGAFLRQTNHRRHMRHWRRNRVPSCRLQRAPGLKRRGLEHRRNIDIERSDSCAKRAQRRTAVRRQAFDPRGRPINQTARFGQPDQQRAQFGTRFGIGSGCFDLAQRLERGQCPIEPDGQRCQQPLALLAGQAFQRRVKLEPGGEQAAPGFEPGDFVIVPQQPRSIESKPRRAPVQFGQQGFSPLLEQDRQVPFGRGQQQLTVSEAAQRINLKAKTDQMADPFTIDFNLIVIDQLYREQGGIGAELFHQHRCAAVDEPFGQPRVERIGQAGLDRPGASGHLFFGQHPIGPLGNVGPTADRGDPHLQSVDITGRIVELGDRPRDEIAAKLAIAQILPQARDKPRMGLGALVTEIGQAADLPEPLDLPRSTDSFTDFGIFGQAAQHCQINRLNGRGQLGPFRRPRKIGNQGIEARKIELGFAPQQSGLRRKAVFLDRVDFLGRKLRVVAAAAGQRPESPIALMAPGAPGDLGHFSAGQTALADPVKFAEPRKGDVFDIEIEPHADRIGGDQIVYLAVLIELDLLVAGFGGKRAHHHRRAAAKPAEHFGDSVNLFGTEGDNRTARRNSAELLGPAMAQCRKARAADNLGPGQQSADRRLDCGRTQQHGFFAPPGVQHAIGEDVPALTVGGELGFVEGDKGQIGAHRHGLDRAQQIAGGGRFDPLLSGDQRNLGGALDGTDLVIDFARQQPQRKPDHAR